MRLTQAALPFKFRKSSARVPLAPLAYRRRGPIPGRGCLKQTQRKKIFEENSTLNDRTTISLQKGAAQFDIDPLFVRARVTISVFIAMSLFTAHTLSGLTQGLHQVDPYMPFPTCGADATAMLVVRLFPPFLFPPCHARGSFPQ